MEASPGFQSAKQKYERIEPYRSAAEGLAYSTLTDEEACARLREWIHGSDEAVREAVEWSARFRRSYTDDRADRLLAAAATNEPVQPIDPAELFRAEETLGHLPLGEAFDRLQTREPKLAKLRVAAEADGANLPHDDEWEGDTKRNLEVYRLFADHESRKDDPLLGTLVARSIAMDYLRVIAGVPPPRDLTTPYFDDFANADLDSQPPPSATI